VHQSDGSEYETVVTSDTEHVFFDAMTEEELQDAGFAEGTRVTVVLPDALEQETLYYVTLTEQAFSSADGSILSASLDDDTTWQIETGRCGFTLDEEGALYAGDTVTAQILLGEEAVYAQIDQVDADALTFAETEFSESAEVEVTLQKSGRTTFQISSYAEDGSLLEEVAVTLTVR
jgi:hypothetical protein